MTHDHRLCAYATTGAVAFIIILTIFASTLCAQYTEVRGVIDVRSHFSDGDYSIDQLAHLARSRGLDAIFINDHDLLVMEYGFPPFRHLFKQSYERNSILKQGASTYLKAIEDTQKNHPDIVIIPGSETAPFYFWTGVPWGEGLTAHNHERRLLTIGLARPDDYHYMPILHNQLPFSITRIHQAALMYLGAAILSCVLALWRGVTRIVGGIALIISLLLFFNSEPLRASPFDAYSGDQGTAPYNLVINYVTSRGGLVFWNYPETRSGVRRLGPIHVETRPYPEMLLKTKGYTGFAALYGENTTVTEPGNIWDVVLNEYCLGYRTWPPWAIATSDYHGEGKDGNYLGNYTTIFWVQEKTRREILAAMQRGRMYACATDPMVRLNMDEFTVSSPDGTITGISGEEVTVKGHPQIKIRLSVTGMGKKGPIQIRLIRSGRLLATYEGDLPLAIAHEDAYYRPGEKIFYRIDARGSIGKLVSNPIFVTFAR